MKKFISLLVIFTLVASTFAATVSAATVSYNGFSVYCTPSAFNVEMGSSATIDVTIGIANNPGLWAARIFVVYPEGLSLKGTDGQARAVATRNVFTGSNDFIAGSPDVPLSDSSQPSAFKKLIAKQNISTEGYCAAILYFECDSIYTKATADGSLATLSFTLTDLAKSGEEMDIRLYYCADDFLSASITQNNKPSFTTHSPKTYSATVNVASCAHVSYTTETKAPTCTEDGYKKTLCALCGYVSSESVLKSPGHSYTAAVVPPTATEQGYTTHTCSECSHSYTDSYTEPTGTTGIKGDVNNDYFVTSMDLNLIKRIVGGTFTPTNGQMTAADFNGDGVVTAVDSNLLARFIAGAIS